MLRWGFNILAALSLLICIGSGLLWYRGTHTQDVILHAAAGRCILIDVAYDSVRVRRYEGWPTTEPWQWQSAPLDCYPGPEIRHFAAGNGYYVTLDDQGRAILKSDSSNIWQPSRPMHLSGPMTLRTLTRLNFSSLLSLSVPLPLIWLGIRVYRWNTLRLRRKTGCCLNCGYDLRASREKCPECGTPIPASQPAPTAFGSGNFRKAP